MDLKLGSAKSLPCLRYKKQLSARKSTRSRPRKVVCANALPKLGDLGGSAVVVGAGIAGLATAVALHKVGVPVVVLERSEGLRGEGAAIGVWTNAWRALEQLGVADELRREHLELSRIELCKRDGSPLTTFPLSVCDGGPHEFRGVRRLTLLNSLLSKLPPGTVKYNVPIEGVSWGSPDAAESATGGVSLSIQGGEEVEVALLVGADGARSAIASVLGLPPPSYQGYVACRGVATFPPGSSLPLPTNTCRQVFGQGVRAGMYPISDSECYWFTVFNAPEGLEPPTTAEGRRQEALSCVPGWQAGILECIEATPLEAITRSRIVDRWTFAGTGRGALTLAGDASHPMTPNLGQGGCVGLEDAVVLGRSVREAGGLQNKAALEAALRKYEKERTARALPITVRSNLMGAALQLPYPPVTFARDWVVSNVYNPSHFLDHATFDCGSL